MDKILFFAPSYKRPDDVITHKYLPYITYVVAEFEAEKYLANNYKVWVVPNEAQGNLCRIRNYILDNADSKKIIIVDDDMSFIGRWNNQKAKKLNAEEVLEFCENAFNLCDDLKIKYWGVNLLPDKGAYREYTPFSFTNYIGGPFQAFNDLDLRYDENLPLKEDYDLSLQVLNKYRKTLRFNAYHYGVKQHINKGGCADYRTKKREEEQFLLLQKKWGNKIVTRDKSSKGWDLNPIVKIPIRGV
tara:strand:- start:256 stop:987 length:732 start_codon:yes stop_codon:yes gene_type:complete